MPELFGNYYITNINWMDDPKIDKTATLKLFYPTYFMNDGSLNYSLIKENLALDKKSKSSREAQELLKALFKFPYKTEKSIRTHDLKAITQQFGHKIIAHGVEEAKGGMHNLLCMCISNCVQTPNVSWGTFHDGLPNISPLSHGPYFLIYSTNSHSQQKPPHNPRFSEIARILVPFQGNRAMLTAALTKMQAVNLITQESKNSFLEKLVTYSEFLTELRAIQEPKSTNHRLFSQMPLYEVPSPPQPHPTI